MRVPIRLSALSLFAALAGCTPSSGGIGTTIPGDQPKPQLPRPGQSGGAGGKMTSTTMRYVCRGQEGTGWIAVDYISDAEACSTMRAGNNGVSVIVPLSNTAVGGFLEVCADQLVPTYWHKTQMNPGDARCPPMRPGSGATTITVMTIQRDR